jgi:predicted nucleic acid-binding Zn ribbon protein
MPPPVAAVGEEAECERGGEEGNRRRFGDGDDLAKDSVLFVEDEELVRVLRSDFMPIYVYDTIDSRPVRRFEVKQSMRDDALRFDPESGRPVRRVISGGYGYLGKGKKTESGSAGAGGCGSGACGCC